MVKDDDTVAVRPIGVGQQDEVQAVVTNGVEPDERVVTTGFARLTEGTKVAATAERPTTDQPRAAPQAPARGRDGAQRNRQRQ